MLQSKELFCYRLNTYLSSCIKGETTRKKEKVKVIGGMTVVLATLIVLIVK